MALYQNYVETLVSYGGQATAAVTQAQIAAGVVVVKAYSGRLCRVIVTTATTAAQNITIFDNASAGSGTIIGIIPGGATVGQSFDFHAPAVSGITIGQNASLAAGAMTVSFI
jgi:hypothetical protein